MAHACVQAHMHGLLCKPLACWELLCSKYHVLRQWLCKCCIDAQKHHRCCNGNTLELSTVGVQLILGLNGVIWVSAESSQTPEQASSTLASEAQPTLVRHVSKAERQAIARVANCIRALAKLYFSIHPASILSVYTVSSISTRTLLAPQHANTLLHKTSASAARFVECFAPFVSGSCPVSLECLSSKKGR